MLNKYKSILLILVGLAVFLVLWMVWLTPLLLRIPENFNYTAEIISVDNFFDESINDYRGEQYSKTNWAYYVVSSTKNVLTIKNDFSVYSLDGAPIFKVSRHYGVNAQTGEHVPGTGDRDRSGYLFAPRNLKKGQPFTYWHVNYDAPTIMKFVAEEKINGLKVYKYQSKYEGVVVDQTENLTFLPGVGVTRGVELKPELEIWVEPVTGRLVKYQDHTVANFYDLKTGEQLNSWNKFSNRVSDSSAELTTKELRYLKMQYIFVQTVIPGVVIFIFILVFLLRLPVFKKVRLFEKQNRIAVIVLFFLASLSGIGFFLTRELINKKINLEFIRETEYVKNALEARMNIYFNVLTSAKALFDSSANVTREEWRTFISSINVQKNYPGIQGVGYTRIFKLEEKDAIVAEVRADGYPNFSVKPEGERDLYSSIIFLEPFDERNQRAFGFDMLSEPTRRKAMLRARDLGVLSISEKVTLLQEGKNDIQAGFLAYVPVYKKGSPTNTEDQRRKAIQGFAYSPFRMNDLMRGVLGDTPINLDIHIYSGLSNRPESFMFDAENDNAEFSEDAHTEQIFKTTEIIYLGGYPWTIEFVNKNGFKPNWLDRNLPYLILSVGLTFSILLSGLIFSFGRAKQKAVIYANELTLDLQKSAAELEQKNKKIEEKLAELDQVNRVMVGRELSMVDLKEEIARLKKQMPEV